MVNCQIIARSISLSLVFFFLFIFMTSASPTIYIIAPDLFQLQPQITFCLFCLYCTYYFFCNLKNKPPTTTIELTFSAQIHFLIVFQARGMSTRNMITALVVAKNGRWDGWACGWCCSNEAYRSILQASNHCQQATEVLELSCQDRQQKHKHNFFFKLHAYYTPYFGP